MLDPLRARLQVRHDRQHGVASGRGGLQPMRTWQWVGACYRTEESRVAWLTAPHGSCPARTADQTEARRVERDRGVLVEPQSDRVLAGPEELGQVIRVHPDLAKTRVRVEIALAADFNVVDQHTARAIAGHHDGCVARYRVERECMREIPAGKPLRATIGCGIGDHREGHPQRAVQLRGELDLKRDRAVIRQRAE